MKRRIRKPKTKPGELRAYFASGDDGDDIYYAHGGGGACKPDAMMLAHAFEELQQLHGKSLRDELVARGYDIATLTFYIMKSPTPEATPR